MQVASSRRALRTLSLLAAVATYLLIVLGAIVRVTGSGKGCPGWPLCYGIAPLPQLHSIIEYAHRITATVVTLLVLSTAFVAWTQARRSGHVPRLAVVAVFLLAVQIVLGGVTVLTDLRASIVAVHMATALALLGTLIALALFSASREDTSPRRAPGIRRGLALGTASALAVTFVTVVAGSVVVSTNSDSACPAWPQCSTQSFLPRTGLEDVNFLHRLLVVLLAVLLAVVIVQLWSLRRTQVRLWTAGQSVLALLAAQVLLGALNVWLKAPPLWEGAHVAGAAAVWGAVVALAVLLYQTQEAGTSLTIPRSAGASESERIVLHG